MGYSAITAYLCLGLLRLPANMGVTGLRRLRLILLSLAGLLFWPVRVLRSAKKSAALRMAGCALLLLGLSIQLAALSGYFRLCYLLAGAIVSQAQLQFLLAALMALATAVPAFLLYGGLLIMITLLLRCPIDLLLPLSPHEHETL